MTQETVVKTGLRKFDKLTGGIRSSDLVCILSRPSQGKTALALDIAANVALARKPRPALLFLPEMSESDLLKRLLLGRPRLPVIGLLSKNGGLARLLTAGARLPLEAPRGETLYFHDAAGPRIEQIARASRRVARELRSKGRALGLVVIDPLQLIKGTREPSLSDAAARLKRLAREIGAPILFTAPLTRRRGLGPDGEPRAEEMVRVTDIVAFLYRGGSRRGQRADSGAAEIVLAKNARGRTGAVPLRFARELARFRN
jgi:replicative DNA helicase